MMNEQERKGFDELFDILKPVSEALKDNYLDALLQDDEMRDKIKRKLNQIEVKQEKNCYFYITRGQFMKEEYVIIRVYAHDLEEGMILANKELETMGHDYDEISLLDKEYLKHDRLLRSILENQGETI